MNENKKIVIECDCGTHLLHVQSDIEDGRQEFYLSMFYYGIHNHKRKWWKRISIAWKYLKTGEMYSDQLCLNHDEAKRLADFIIENKK